MTQSQDPSPELSTPRPPHPQDPDFWSIENFKTLAWLLLCITVIRSSVVSPFQVPTGSMIPTIKPGDRIIANKMAYDFKIPFTDKSLFKTGTFTRGDIVVFIYPKDPSLDYVKRIIGLPGDRVRIIDDVVYVNGEVQNKETLTREQAKPVLEDIGEPSDLYHLSTEALVTKDATKKHWAMHRIPGLAPFSQAHWPQESNEYIVPEDALFVMGDNRHNSADSRSWGKVPMSYVKGKALFVLWSLYFEDEDWSKPRFRFRRFGKWLDSF